MANYHAYTQTVADGTATSVVRPSDWNSAHVQVFALSGNTIGSSRVSGLDITYVGGNNITLSADTAGSKLVISAGNYLTTAAQSNQVVNSLNGSTGQVSLNVGSSLSSSTNGSSITFGLASNITTALQSAGAYLTTAAQSNQVVNSINGSTGTFSFNTASSLSSSRVGNAITFGLASNITTALQSAGAYLTTAMQSNAATISNIKVSAGTLSSNRSDLTFSNGNGVSFGLETNGVITASVAAAGGAQTGISGIVVSNATYTSGTVTFQNANGITFGSSGANGISASHNGLTTAMASNRGSDFMGTNTALTANGVSMTANSSGLSLNFPAFLTTAALSNHSHGFATTTTNGSNIIVGTTNSVGATIGVPPFITTYAAQTTQPVAASGSNGSFAFSTLSFGNLNGLSFYTSNGSIVGSYTAGAGGGGLNIGVSNLGSTAGSTGTVSTGDVVFVGTNGILLSQSTGAGGTNATISVGPQVMSYWANNLYLYNTQTFQVRQSTSIVFPVVVGYPLTIDHVRHPLTVNIASTSLATTANTTFSAAVFYTLYYGFFSTNTAIFPTFTSALSTTAGITHQVQIAAGAVGSQYTVSHGITFPTNNTFGGSGTFSTSFGVSTSNFSINTAGNSLSNYTGFKILEAPFLSSLAANMYWGMMGVSSTTSTQGVAGLSGALLAHSYIGMSQSNNPYGMFGGPSVNAIGYATHAGTLSGTNIISSYSFSQVASSASNVIPYIQLEYDGT